MHHYKDENDKCYAFNDLQVANGSVKEYLIAITEEEATILCNPPECLEICRCRVSKTIREECESHINAGFIADILFPDSNYRNDRDQQRTIEKAANNEGGYIWMNEDFTYHSKTQALQLLILSDSLVESCRLKNSKKQEYLKRQDLTTEQINTVTWDSVES
jgi:hypothetical protein